MFLQGLTEEASDAIIVVTDANNDVGVGANAIVGITGAAFGEVGFIETLFAVIEEVFVDDFFFLLFIFLFVFLWLFFLLAVGNDFVGGILGGIESIIDSTVVIIGISEVRVANFADEGAEVDVGAIGGNTAFIDLSLTGDESIESVVDASIGGLHLLGIEIDDVQVVAEIIVSFDEIIFGNREAIAGL